LDKGDKNPMTPQEILHSFSDAHLLISGGAGYLATNILLLLKDTRCHITLLDRPGAVFPDIPGKPEVVRVLTDVRSSTVWDDHVDHADIVFHFAAQTSVYVSNSDPWTDLQINFLPMVHLLETCRKKRRQLRLLFSSTATVFGLPQSLPVDETHPDDPLTAYDLHKLLAERYLKRYAHENIVKGTILRLANVYGPGPRTSSADRGVLNLMMHKALKGEPLSIYGEGNFVRDYVFVEDVAWAFLMAAAAMEDVNGKHFVIGSGEGHTLARAITMVSERAQRKTGVQVPVLHTQAPSTLSPIEYRNFIADSRKFNSATGWKATCPLEEGIDRTLSAMTDSEG
jgi:nucleoside-diphosphate-sugar epimerase